jgi:hypothetical protein
MKRIIIKQMPDGCHVICEATGVDHTFGRPQAKRWAKQYHMSTGYPVFNVKRSGAEVQVTPYPQRIIAIPEWAEAVILHANAIDGSAPEGGRVDKERFIKFQGYEFRRCKREGRGEWDMLLYAWAGFGEPNRKHVYGRDNPYTQLRTTKHCRVKLLGSWSYMTNERERVIYKL